MTVVSYLASTKCRLQRTDCWPQTEKRNVFSSNTCNMSFYNLLRVTRYLLLFHGHLPLFFRLIRACSEAVSQSTWLQNTHWLILDHRVSWILHVTWVHYWPRTGCQKTITASDYIKELAWPWCFVMKNSLYSQPAFCTWSAFCTQDLVCIFVLTGILSIVFWLHLSIPLFVYFPIFYIQQLNVKVSACIACCLFVCGARCSRTL